MNYIELINQFWRTRRSKRITGNQADVYYCLVQECNERNWENPFEFPNMSICARIGITEPTLIDARARLKQLGLIEFEAGERKVKSPVYQILYLNDLSITFSKTLGINRAKTEYKPSKKVNLLNKTKHKQNLNENKEKTLLSEIEISNVPDSEKLFFEITLNFWKLFQKNLLELKINSTDLEKAKIKNWVDPIRLMFTKDNRKIEEIREVYNFLKNEPINPKFTWKANIRSTVTLREKFERLLVDSRKSKLKPIGTKVSNFDNINRLAEQMKTELV